MKTTSTLAKFLKSVAKALGAVGGFSFLVGGGLIHAETKMDRFSAELVGAGIAAAFLILAFVVSELAERLTNQQENSSIAPND